MRERKGKMQKERGDMGVAESMLLCVPCSYCWPCFGRLFMSRKREVVCVRKVIVFF